MPFSKARRSRLLLLVATCAAIAFAAKASITELIGVDVVMRTIVKGPLTSSEARATKALQTHPGGPGTDQRLDDASHLIITETMLRAGCLLSEAFTYSGSGRWSGIAVCNGMRTDVIFTADRQIKIIPH